MKNSWTTDKNDIFDRRRTRNGILFEQGLLPRIKECCNKTLEPIFRRTKNACGYFFRCSKIVVEKKFR
jgi:hypothetical protein